jgi:hypothetical protein
MSKMLYRLNRKGENKLSKSAIETTIIEGALIIRKLREIDFKSIIIYKLFMFERKGRIFETLNHTHS